MSAPAVEPRGARILHLVSSERWTGVAEPVVSVALHQQRAGCEAWLACIPSRSFEREAKRRGLRVLTDLYLDRRLNPFHVLGDLRRLRRFVERERIDVVHTHLINDHWLAALALRGMKRPRLLAHPAAYRRDQMMHGGIFFRYNKLGHRNRAVIADPPQVISFKVDDHHMLCPVFWAAYQFALEPVILIS